MNSVHEQCPKSDSKTVLSPKTGSKTGWVHQEHSVHSHSPACMHRRAQARARVAASWALRSCSSRGPRPCRRVLCCVAGAPASCRRRPRALSQAPQRRVAGRDGRVATQRLQPSPPFWSQYNLCIAIQKKPSS